MLSRVTDSSASVTTVLAVDDESTLLRLIKRVLERADYRVMCARDGEEAMELFAKYHDEIAAVLLDVIIPPNGAREIMVAMRKLHPEIPVLLSSGDRLDDALEVELAAGRGCFLRKPYVPKTLVEALEALIASRS
jgi:CheY-like chemotaxis protein